MLEFIFSRIYFLLIHNLDKCNASNECSENNFCKQPGEREATGVCEDCRYLGNYTCYDSEVGDECGLKCYGAG